MNKFQKFIINHDKDTFEAYYRTHLNEDVFKQYTEIIDLHDLGKIRKLWNIPAKTKEEKAAIIENFCGGHDFYVNLAEQTKINYRVLYNKQDIDNLLLELGGK